MSGYADILGRWATEFDASGRTATTPLVLSNSVRLAKGRLNIAILMIEPCNSHATKDYETMLAESPSLLEVNRLIRECCPGCSIDDVSVFDVRPLISEEMQRALGTDWPIWEREGHRVFEELMHFKKPDIILSLQAATRNASSPLSKSLSGRLRASARPSIVQFGGHKALLYRAFHPSSYLRSDYTISRTPADVGKLEACLEVCFNAAFRACRGQPYMRWNNYNTSDRPWQYLCSMVAHWQKKDSVYAQSLRPSQIYQIFNLGNDPQMRAALLHEVDIEYKLQELKEATLRASKEDTTPEYVVKYLASLSI